MSEHARWKLQSSGAPQANCHQFRQSLLLPLRRVVVDLTLRPPHRVAIDATLFKSSRNGGHVLGAMAATVTGIGDAHLVGGDVDVIVKVVVCGARCAYVRAPACAAREDSARVPQGATHRERRCLWQVSVGLAPFAAAHPPRAFTAAMASYAAQFHLPNRHGRVVRGARHSRRSGASLLSRGATCL